MRSKDCTFYITLIINKLLIPALIQGKIDLYHLQLKLFKVDQLKNRNL